MAEPSPVIVSEEIEAFIAHKLRAAFPYLKSEALTELAHQCAGNVQECLIKQTPAMAESKKRSGFMALSPELRNRIYDLVLQPTNSAGDRGGGESSFKHICIQPYNDHYAFDPGFTGELKHALRECHGDYEQVPRTWGEKTIWRKQPAITQVSRQVREETLPLYYGLNTFVAYTENREELPNDESVASRQRMNRLANQLSVTIYGNLSFDGYGYQPPTDRKEVVLRTALKWAKDIGPKNAALIKRFHVYHVRGETDKQHVLSALEGNLPESAVRFFVGNGTDRFQYRWVECRDEDAHLSLKELWKKAEEHPELADDVDDEDEEHENEESG